MSKIRIGLDIATNTGYCIIKDNKILEIGVKQLWFKQDYRKSATQCRRLIEQLMRHWQNEECVISIELSKYGNNTTYIFSMLTGMIIESLNVGFLSPQVKIRLIDPKTWQKYVGIVKGEDTKQRSIEIANNTIHNENIVSPHEIKDDNEADAFNLAYYGPDINDIFEIKQIQLGKKKKKMSIQRALSTLYKKEHDWLQKLDEAHELDDTLHTKKSFNRVKKCEKKLNELQEQINKIKEENK